MHRILMVDDDGALRRGLLRGIVRAVRAWPSVQTEQASCAEEARILVESHPDDTWILVLDHNMPAKEKDLVKSGLALAQRLHETPSVNTTVIMIGSMVTEEEARLVGAIWLPKPIESQQLMAKILPLLPPKLDSR